MGFWWADNLPKPACKHGYILVQLLFLLKSFQIMEKNNNSKKGGRPLKLLKLKTKLRVCMADQDVRICTEKAKQANISLAEYIRRMVLNGAITNLFSEEEQQHKIQLIGMANNLNQLAKEAHTYGLVSVEQSASKALKDIRSILDRYKVHRWLPKRPQKENPFMVL